jgi:hypothetical protein
LEKISSDIDICSPNWLNDHMMQTGEASTREFIIRQKEFFCQVYSFALQGYSLPIRELIALWSYGL